MLVLNNITRLQQQQEIQHNLGISTGVNSGMPATKHSSVQSMSPPKSFSGGISSHGSSGMGTSLTSPQLLSNRQGRSPRNSSPNNPGGNLTANLHKMDLTSSSSGIGGTSASDKNMTQDFSAILNEMSVGDRRAPGCEKKVVQIAAADYEQKKFLATKAIQNKPMGEPRTPNPVWSGFGFSSSMPEAVIREKLAQEHAHAKQPRETNVASNSDWLGQFNTSNVSAVPSENDELSCLLCSQGLSKYTDIFLRHEIDLPTFATLTDEELKEIGIPTFGARKKLLMLARETKKQQNQKF